MTTSFKSREDAYRAADALLALANRHGWRGHLDMNGGFNVLTIEHAASERRIVIGWNPDGSWRVASSYVRGRRTTERMSVASARRAIVATGGGDRTPMTTTTTRTVRADQLTRGDVVVQLVRDGMAPITAGRARIADVRDVTDPERVYLVFEYRSRECITRCHTRPYECWHYGTAGGGSSTIRRDQMVEVYNR